MRRKTRGTESAGKMIKFAQAGKFFSKTSPTRKTTKHNLCALMFRKFPQKQKISPSARLRTRVGSAPLRKTLVFSSLSLYCCL